MFLLRSAFWLTLAFIVLAPRDVDLGAAAQSAATEVVTAGQEAVVKQVMAQACLGAGCLVLPGAPQLRAAPPPPLPEKRLAVLGDRTIPLPRPRPAGRH